MLTLMFYRMFVETGMMSKRDFFRAAALGLATGAILLAAVFYAISRFV